MNERAKSVGLVPISGSSNKHYLFYWVIYTATRERRLSLDRLWAPKPNKQKGSRTTTGYFGETRSPKPNKQKGSRTSGYFGKTRSKAERQSLLVRTTVHMVMTVHGTVLKFTILVCRW